MTAKDSNHIPVDTAVVGESATDPNQLLLLGEDGHYYAYSLPSDNMVPVEPDEHDWTLETTDPETLFS